VLAYSRPMARGGDQHIPRPEGWRPGGPPPWRDLNPAAVEIVAELDHIGTIVSAFSIAPFVGVLAERPHLVAAPGEVTAVFDVALSDLLHDDTWREERWDLPWVVDAGMPFYELPDETVWGATARILTNLLGFLTAAR